MDATVDRCWKPNRQVREIPITDPLPLTSVPHHRGTDDCTRIWYHTLLPQCLSNEVTDEKNISLEQKCHPQLKVKKTTKN